MMPEIRVKSGVCGRMRTAPRSVGTTRRSLTLNQVEVDWRAGMKPTRMPRPEQEERFWSRVDKSGSCWEWTSHKNQGYGQFAYRIDGITYSWRAHRLSWTLLRREIPEGLHVDHICRNRACVNPDHLEPVTPRVNTLRGISVPAINARKTYCKRGHELTPENIRPRGDKRDCMECRRLNNLKWVAYAKERIKCEECDHVSTRSDMAAHRRAVHHLPPLGRKPRPRKKKVH